MEQRWKWSTKGDIGTQFYTKPHTEDEEHLTAMSLDNGGSGGGVTVRVIGSLSSGGGEADVVWDGDSHIKRRKEDQPVPQCFPHAVMK